MRAVGGWVSGTNGATLEFILDDDAENPINFDGAPPFQGSSFHFFYGVIDDTDSFGKFELRETEGTTGDEEFLWADSFTAVMVPEPATATSLLLGMTVLAMFRKRSTSQLRKLG